jgi:hypothetical protein
MMNEIVMEKLYDTGMTYLTTSVITEKDQRWILRWFRSNKPDLCREVFGDMQHQTYRDSPERREPSVLPPSPPPPVQQPIYNQPPVNITPAPSPVYHPERQPEVTPTPQTGVKPDDHIFDYREVIYKTQNQRFVNVPQDDNDDRR